MREYRKQFPKTGDELREIPEVRYAPPAKYDERLDHLKNFFRAMRTREQVLEDATFGLRAAAPALMANISYFEKRVCEWDPETMKLKANA